jgi:hypothetical protein
MIAISRVPFVRACRFSVSLPSVADGYTSIAILPCDFSFTSSANFSAVVLMEWLAAIWWLRVRVTSGVTSAYADVLESAAAVVSAEEAAAVVVVGVLDAAPQPARSDTVRARLHNTDDFLRIMIFLQFLIIINVL